MDRTGAGDGAATKIHSGIRTLAGMKGRPVMIARNDSARWGHLTRRYWLRRSRQGRLVCDAGRHDQVRSAQPSAGT